MMTDDTIASLIRELARIRGWEETYAARKASGSGDTLSRIAGGIGLTIRRGNVIIERCSDLWPDDAAWPADIPRPSSPKSKERAT